MPSLLITGADKGLGLKAVQYVASTCSREIVIAGRDSRSMQAVADDLNKSGGVKVRTIIMDVSSLFSVRQGAAAFKEMVARGEVGPLRTLVLNAGAQFQAAPEYSVDGYEKTFATNCLGSFLLANLLLQDIEDGGRVLWTASGTHDPETMDGKMVGKAVQPDAQSLAEDGKHGKPLPGGVRYTTSKLCDILYSYELDRRLRAHGKNVASIAYDPGFVPATGLIRTAPGFAQRLIRTGPLRAFFKLLGVTPGDLAFSGTGLGRVAVDAAYAEMSGKYIQSNDHRLLEARSSKMSYDKALATRLWRDTAQLVGLSPPDGLPSES